MNPPSLLAEALRIARGAGAAADRSAAAVLDRLAADDRATKAVAKMTTDIEVACRIVRCCLMCETNCRDFTAMVAAEKAMPARLDGLAAAARSLDQFVIEMDAGPAHALAAYVALDPGEADYLRAAISTITGLIEGRRRVAAETLPRVGATNKYKEGDETAAIGWLAEGIEAITGRPNYQHVATLAQITLKTKDVTDDRVRDALSTRRDRPWRRP